MSSNIDSRVTMSLHPQTFSAIEGYDEQTAPYVSEAVFAFGKAYEGVRQIYAVRDAAAQNPTWNEAKQIIETDSRAEKIISGVARALDAANSDLSKKIEYIEEILTTPIQEKAAAAISQEIRAHAKGLTDGERMSFVQAAIKQGDEITVSAILGAPPYLSGLQAGMQEMLTRHWHKTASPELAIRLKVIQVAQAKLQEHGPLIFSEREKAVGVLTDSKTGRKISPRELRDLKAQSEAAFYAIL
ncbi:MAG: hypothetical protein LKE96_10335 [Acetobacter peroxydans]|jgi:hypothetical protein|nr:hypothetical protein [Acetobacter peroxydans]